MFLNGIILVNKIEGISSAGVVKAVKSLLGCKVGHGGTLDPLATGVLPILVGEGTKFGAFSLNESKTYHAEILLGVSTNTGDREGNITETKNVTCSTVGIKNVLTEFVGGYTQTVPSFSAVKVRGVPLYKRARKGLPVEKVKRKVEIKEIKLLSLNIPTFIIEVSCSKGTYIRSLAEDIGARLGCGAHITNLKRTSVGEFTITESFSLSEIAHNYKLYGPKIIKEKYIRPIELFLKDFASFHLVNTEVARIIDGVAITIPPDYKNSLSSKVIKLYDENKNFIGLGEVRENKIFPKRLINTETIR